MVIRKEFWGVLVVACIAFFMGITWLLQTFDPSKRSGGAHRPNEGNAKPISLAIDEQPASETHPKNSVEKDASKESGTSIPYDVPAYDNNTPFPAVAKELKPNPIHPIYLSDNEIQHLMSCSQVEAKAIIAQLDGCTLPSNQMLSIHAQYKREGYSEALARKSLNFSHPFAAMELANQCMLRHDFQGFDAMLEVAAKELSADQFNQLFLATGNTAHSVRRSTSMVHQGIMSETGILLAAMLALRPDGLNVAVDYFKNPDRRTQDKYSVIQKLKDFSTRKALTPIANALIGNPEGVQRQIIPQFRRIALSLPPEALEKEMQGYAVALVALGPTSAPHNPEKALGRILFDFDQNRDASEQVITMFLHPDHSGPPSLQPSLLTARLRYALRSSQPSLQSLP